MTDDIDLGELRANFEYNDSDGDGQIDFDEFKRMLTALDAFHSDEEARAGFAAVDTDGDRRISFDEFMGWWSDR